MLDLTLDKPSHMGDCADIRNVDVSCCQDRYESLVEDPDIPAFHYGSHYSSAGANAASSS